MNTLFMLLLGGRFERFHTSSTCEWYRWVRVKDGRLAVAFDRWVNP